MKPTETPELTMESSLIVELGQSLWAEIQKLKETRTDSRFESNFQYVRIELAKMKQIPEG